MSMFFKDIKFKGFYPSNNLNYFGVTLKYFDREKLSS